MVSDGYKEKEQKEGGGKFIQISSFAVLRKRNKTLHALIYEHLYVLEKLRKGRVNIILLHERTWVTS